MASATTTTAVLEAAQSYTRAGISVVPVPRRRKEPVLSGWQNLRLNVADLPALFGGEMNIGALTGAPSGDLVDGDLDVPEAIQAAAVFMPATGRIHGRASNPHSHRWYRVPGGIKTVKFQYPESGDDKKQTMYVELRSTGCQTLIPPSVHPQGEQYMWERNGQAATVDAATLRTAAGKTAACVLLARHWPGEGSRDDAALALCGMLLRAGWSEEVTDEFVTLVAELAGDEEWSKRDKGRGTKAALDSGEEVTGAPRLAELLHDGKQVVTKAREWLGVRNGQSGKARVEPAWEDEPEPLPDGLPAVVPFAIEMLPAALRGWVWDVAERMQAPVDFPAVAAMVALTAVVGRQVGIHPKEKDEWPVVPNLWGAIVGRPSTMKTPSLEEGLKPLARLVAEANAKYEQEVAHYDQAMLMYEAKKAAHEAAVKKAARAGENDTELASLIAQAPEKPALPIKRRYRTNDATVEKLGEMLLQNPRGLLVFRDELIGWLRKLDEAGHESDRGFYLESFNGNGSYEVDRIGRGSLYIPALCLSLLGGIQPGPLASYVYDASNAGKGDDGLLQRFQLLVWPDEPNTWRNVDRYADTEAKNAAYDVFTRMAELDTAALGAVIPTDANGTPEPGAIPMLRFSPAAQGIFNEWRDELERRLKAGEMSAPLEAHLTKYRSLMPSLALLFHLVDGTPEDAEEDDRDGVSAEAATRAATWCAYLESHAKRLYAHAENPGLERARALLDHIKAGAVVDCMPVRQIIRHHWARLTTPDEVDDACALLEAYGWVQVQAERSQGGLGRPSPRLRIHPSLARDASGGRQAA